MFVSAFKEQLEVYRLEEGYHILGDNGSVLLLVTACFRSHGRPPHGVFTRTVGASGKEGLVVIIFPLLRMRSTAAHAYAVEGASQDEVAEPALLFRNQRGQGFIDGLGEMSNGF